MPEDKPQDHGASEHPEVEKSAEKRFNRRSFLKLAGIASASLAAGGVIEACKPTSNQATAPPVGTGPIAPPENLMYTNVPPSPMTPPPTKLAVLTPDEAKTVDALVARLYPGTPDDPGARELGVVNYIDKMLAFHDGAVEPAYSKGPVAKPYEGSQPPAPSNPPEIIYVAKDELPRYGPQGIANPLKTYRAGITEVNAYAMKLYQKNYADLTEQQQDKILTDMQDDNASDDFKSPTGPSFFMTLREHTIEGVFSDPGYGGNVNMVGWKQIGYPGAQRAYTVSDFHTEGQVRPPQTLAMLPPFHPGLKVNNTVIVPNAGASEENNPNNP